MKILVSDSDRDFAESVGWYLQDAGYEVVLASGSKETEEVFMSSIPGLAIWDVRMNNDLDSYDRSGFVLARKLVQFSPIIILSASSIPNGETIPDGVVYFLKRTGPAALLEIVKDIL